MRNNYCEQKKFTQIDNYFESEKVLIFFQLYPY